MLQGLFNYDNPVWRFIGKLGDLIVLNILWIICSIPIFTAGASTTAVYYVTLRLARDEDGYTFRSYFKSFRENFKQATAIWLILLVSGLLLGFDLYFCFKVLTGNSTVRTVFTAAIGALAIMWLFMFTYAFPLQSRFYNPVKRTLFNALFMSIRHIPFTFGILLIDGVLLFLSYLSVFWSPQFTIMAVMFGFPMLAFVNSFMFNHIFKRYIPEEKIIDDGELRPILEDVAITRPVQPGGGKSEEMKEPGEIKSETESPEEIKTETKQPEEIKSETKQPEEIKSETGQPEEIKSETE